MNSLIVISFKQAKQLIAKAISNKLKNINKRVYISYGSTNQMILNELGFDNKKYYNGYIDKKGLHSNKNRDKFVVLNNLDNDIDEVKPDDIIIKGANALAYENSNCVAGVAVASQSGGTYGNFILKASCVGAKVLIPVTHEKLVPQILDNQYTQNDFKLSMGLNVTLFRFNYGEVYTEIEAIKDLYNLKAKLYLAGDINSQGLMTFIVNGKKENIIKIKEFLND